MTQETKTAVEESLDALLFNVIGDLQEYNENGKCIDVPFTKEETEVLKDIISDIRNSVDYDIIIDYLYYGLIGKEEGSPKTNRSGQKALQSIITKRMASIRQIFKYDMKNNPNAVPTREELVRDLNLTKSLKLLREIGNYPEYVLRALISKYDIKNGEWLDDELGSGLRDYEIPMTKEELEADLLKGMTQAEIMKKYYGKVSKNNYDKLFSHCIYHGIDCDLRHPQSSFKESQKEQLIKLLQETINEGARKSKVIGIVANKLNITHIKLWRWLEEYGIRIRNIEGEVKVIY